MAKITQTRINMDRVAEGLLVFLCTLVQCFGALLMLGIFALTFVAVFRSDDQNDGHPGVQTWCGLFPFYFTDTVGINRARWFDYPDCTPVKPFVRVN
ncbi:g9044 [Coccomyxa viridis]|uniref:G9044 protein n=1 Tax=Coccomyxa viridis TaxID=1274662 RepID=A0ABP1G350_9CHLO